MEWWNLWIPFIGTLIVAVFNGLLSNSQNKKNTKFQEKISKQQIDANLKAKARIEWISEVRELVSELISGLYRINFIMEKMQITERDFYIYNSGVPDIEKREENNVKNLKQLNELAEVTNNNASTSEKLLLHFSKKEEHLKIDKKIGEVANLVSQIYKAANNRNLYNTESRQEEDDYVKCKTDEIEEISNDIRNIFRGYLKIEWDKAKEGK